MESKLTQLYNKKENKRKRAGDRRQERKENNGVFWRSQNQNFLAPF